MAKDCQARQWQGQGLISGSLPSKSKYLLDHDISLRSISKGAPGCLLSATVNRHTTRKVRSWRPMQICGPYLRLSSGHTNHKSRWFRIFNQGSWELNIIPEAIAWLWERFWDEDKVYLIHWGRRIICQASRLFLSISKQERCRGRYENKTSNSKCEVPSYPPGYPRPRYTLDSCTAEEEKRQRGQ